MRRKPRYEQVLDEIAVATVQDVEYVLASILRSYERIMAPQAELLVKVNNVLRGHGYGDAVSETVEAALASLSSKKLVFTKWSKSASHELYGPTWRLKWGWKPLLAKLHGMRKAMFWRGINL
jgi:hypothetical protein